MNRDLGQEVVQKLGSSAKFWATDVLDTNSIKAAVDGAVEWIKETGKPIGGVIPAAGVGAPATVSCAIRIPDQYVLSSHSENRCSIGAAIP